MKNNLNYETHKDEVELLKNILFDKMRIEEELPEFVLHIDIVPDVQEVPKLTFIVKINLLPEYPDTEPTVEIEETTNILASSKIYKLKEEISEFSKENYGLPMVYQIYEMIKVKKFINFSLFLGFIKK